MRVAYLGLPIAALLLRADGHEVVAGLRKGLTLGERSFSWEIRAWSSLEAEVQTIHRVLVPGEAGNLDGDAIVRAADIGVALLKADVDGQRWVPTPSRTRLRVVGAMMLT